jgi:hypothetical protein
MNKQNYKVSYNDIDGEQYGKAYPFKSNNNETALRYAKKWFLTKYMKLVNTDDNNIIHDGLRVSR